ncbi:hypothetical protein AB0N93_12000 [Streptomyces sp. NPDC091267]|uniref:WXG100 family type VII secretion target n=1 Tax=Streptomyces sp. NPDC091267 TaxID=3155195 RepID=UPI003416EFF0
MGTDFDRLTHEEMLRWLDEAAGGEIQDAADRLVSAAAQIRRIAEDLRTRPQRVEWKGAGADAFRTWSADLANATLRLGDYGESASKWLAEASRAVTSAQASIPRPQTGIRASLDAAAATRDDPAASAGARRSAETLLALTEAGRQEAAAQMRRLAQTYEFSAAQLTALEKPVFPPLPQEAVPDRQGPDPGGAEGAHLGRTAAGTTVGVSAAHALPPQRAGAEVPDGTAGSAGSAGERLSRAADPAARPAAMALDAFAPPPDARPAPAGPPAGAMDGAARGGVTGPAGAAAPVLAGAPVTQSAATVPDRPAGTPRPVVTDGGSRRSATAVPAEGGGITGGRPVPPAAGRPAAALPRGTVAGAEGGRGTPVVRGPGTGAMGAGAGRSGISGGRAQPLGATGARPFTSGGLPVSRGPRTGQSRAADRDAAGDHLVEDEETWQYGDRRTVPPVIG